MRSPEPDALPLILTHGWPGSVVEFLRRHRPADRSARPRRRPGRRLPPGDPLATRLRLLRADPRGRLDHQPHRPGLGRADGAASATRATARRAATGARSSPRSWAASTPTTSSACTSTRPRWASSPSGRWTRTSWPPSPTPRRSAWSACSQLRRADGNGYFQIQATRPQTLAYGLTDSPVGQLAWIVEKFKEWTHAAAEPPEDAVDRDQLLTNVMLYWLTGTAGSSARLYYENMHAGSWGQPARHDADRRGGVRRGLAIRRYGERGNNIVHWSEFDRGGHFAAHGGARPAGRRRAGVLPGRPVVPARTPSARGNTPSAHDNGEGPSALERGLRLGSDRGLA